MSLKFRSDASSEEWPSMLLPSCLFSLTVTSQTYIDKFVLAVITWLSISHFIIRSIYLRKNSQYLFYVVLSIPIAVFTSKIVPVDGRVIYLTCLLVFVGHNYLISKLLINCPGSFTMGEVQIISQGIMIFILYSIISFKQVNKHSKQSVHGEAVDLLKLLLLGLVLLVCSFYVVPSLRKGLKMHFACFAFATTIILIWSYQHQKNVIFWFLNFCIYDQKRMQLVTFWLILTLAAIFFTIWINRRGYSASTLDRKYFHLIINAIYLGGIIYDIQLLCFASIIALGAFIVLEMYRILEVPYIGSAIGQAFQIFLDEKDSGLLILTHIYLLIGCSCPIWLSSHYVNKNVYHICLLSGVISVGFGDTFAAAGGTLFGRHYWEGSKKTLEGTACAILVQIVSSLIFLYIGHPMSLYNISIVVISAVLTSLLEAKTTQIDNLVLPLFTFTILSWVE